MEGSSAIARFTASARDEAAKGTFGEIRDELGKLIRRALRNPRRRGRIRRLLPWARRPQRRFVVVIQNIDACAGEFNLALCEAAKKLLRIEDVVLIFVGELRTMEEAANQKFALPVDAPDASRCGQRHVRALIPNIVALPWPDADEVRRRGHEPTAD